MVDRNQAAALVFKAVKRGKRVGKTGTGKTIRSHRRLRHPVNGGDVHEVRGTRETHDLPGSFTDENTGRTYVHGEADHGRGVTHYHEHDHSRHLADPNAGHGLEFTPTQGQNDGTWQTMFRVQGLPQEVGGTLPSTLNDVRRGPLTVHGHDQREGHTTYRAGFSKGALDWGSGAGAGGAQSTPTRAPAPTKRHAPPRTDPPVGEQDELVERSLIVVNPFHRAVADPEEVEKAAGRVPRSRSGKQQPQRAAAVTGRAGRIRKEQPKVPPFLAKPESAPPEEATGSEKEKPKKEQSKKKPRITPEAGASVGRVAGAALGGNDPTVAAIGLAGQATGAAVGPAVAAPFLGVKKLMAKKGLAPTADSPTRPQGGPDRGVTNEARKRSQAAKSDDGFRMVSKAMYGEMQAAEPDPGYRPQQFDMGGGPTSPVALNSPLRKGLPTRSIFSGEVHHARTGQMPTNRVRGSNVFRRYPDGRLAMDWAKHRVVEALVKKGDGIPLTEYEHQAVAVVFPEMVKGHPEFARIGTPLSKGEISALRKMVKAFMGERLNYNAGRGGGSVPGSSGA